MKITINLECPSLREEFKQLKEMIMKEFDDLTATVDALIAADEAENTLLAQILAELNALLANPTGVSPTEVTALRDKVAAELVKVNAAVAAATPPPPAG